jgi:hypothetical protein
LNCQTIATLGPSIRNTSFRIDREPRTCPPAGVLRRFGFADFDVIGEAEELERPARSRAEVDQPEGSVVHSEETADLSDHGDTHRVDELEVYAVDDHVATPGVHDGEQVGTELADSVDVHVR